MQIVNFMNKYGPLESEKIVRQDVLATFHDKVILHQCQQSMYWSFTSGRPSLPRNSVQSQQNSCNNTLSSRKMSASFMQLSTSPT